MCNIYTYSLQYRETGQAKEATNMGQQQMPYTTLGMHAIGSPALY
jgi:hypothetical protein